jgi:hypothetical protein
MDRNVGSGFPRGLGKGRVYPDGHRVGRRRPIQGMQDANPVCAFSSGRARSSVLGVRPSASDRLRCRVPGPRCQIAGTRCLVLGTWYLSSQKTRTRGMQDGGDGTAFGGGDSEWHGVCWRLSDVPPVEAAGARIGTAEAAGGRTPWNPRGGGREACICRWWLWVCGGGGGGGPAGERGRLYGRRSPRTIRRGLGHRLWLLKTLNENPGEIRRDGTSSSVHRKRVPTHRPDFPLIRRPRIRRREGCPPEEGSISQPIGPQEAQRDQDLRPPQRE